MKPSNPSNFHRHPSRRGIAAFEFAMLLPLLVAMILLIIYVGNACVQQMNYAKDLHFAIWRLRYDEQPDHIEPLVYTDETQGEIEDEKSDTIETDMIYDKWEHEKKTKAQVFANPWNAQSEWDEESRWAVKKNSGDGLSAEEKEENNQRIFYHQKHDKTYMNNLPYYETTLATPIRNTDYAAPVDD